MDLTYGERRRNSPLAQFPETEVSMPVLLLALLLALFFVLLLLLLLAQAEAVSSSAEARKLEERNCELEQHAAEVDEKYEALLRCLKEDNLLDAAKRMRDLPAVAGKSPYLELYRSLVSLAFILMEQERISEVEAIRRKS